MEIKDNIKIIFVDFDWTIYDHNKKDFDFESISALKKAQQKGIKIFLATARSYDSILDMGFFNLIEPDGIIACNGSVIFYENRIIHANFIPKEIAEKLCKEAVKHHCNVEVTGPKHRYVVSKRSNYLDKVYELFYDKKPTYHKIDDQPICTMLFIGPSKYDDYMKAAQPEGMHFERFFDLGADMSFTEGSKGLAVDFVLKHLDIDVNNTLSFGDSWLDVSMFEHTKYSVCLGNAKDEIKQKASYVADSVSNSGVAKVINEYLDNN